VDGKPKFDQPEIKAMAQKMYALTKLQKQGKFKPKREKYVLSTANGSKEHGGRVRGVSSKLTIKDGFRQDQVSYRRHDCYKEEMKEVDEKALESKFRELFRAAVVEEQHSRLLSINPSQEVGQQQMVMMPPPVLGQANTTCAQSSVSSTIAQPYLVDCISVTTPCLLLYSIGGAGKTKEAAKAQVYPVGGLFEGKPIPPLYACVQVEQLLKSSYEDNEIDISTTDGKNYLEECISSTILWHERDIVLVGPQPSAAPDHTSPALPQQQVGAEPEQSLAPQHTLLALPSQPAPPTTRGITTGSNITTTMRGITTGSTIATTMRAITTSSTITAPREPSPSAPFSRSPPPREPLPPTAPQQQ
jgi:hypothetical protein